MSEEKDISGFWANLLPFRVVERVASQQFFTLEENIII